MTDLIDRTYLSQWSEDTLGIIVHSPSTGEVADPDGNAVTVSFLRADDSVAFTQAATRVESGKYAITFTAAQTSVPGYYRLAFDYTVGGSADHYEIQVEVGSASPAYDALSTESKAIVEQTWYRFADLYDSFGGGPHLQDESRFGRGRLAQLLRQAMGRLNTIAQPHGSYSLEDNNFPYAKWGALLEQALYVEIIKHLIRSYVEQPVVVTGTSISRLERRDYMDRWESILRGEVEDLKEMTGGFKMDHMGLGNVSVLVSGGAYGRYGPTAFPGGMGQAAARGYFFARRF